MIDGEVYVDRYAELAAKNSPKKPQETDYFGFVKLGPNHVVEFATWIEFGEIAQPGMGFFPPAR